MSEIKRVARRNPVLAGDGAVTLLERISPALESVETPACFSALLRAERHGEILSLLEKESFWHYRRWAVLALAATGKKSEAIELAESSRGPWTSDGEREQDL
jgi:hypothetical protein